MINVTTFQQYLQSAFTSGSWSTDEVIEFVLPLFEEVLSFHENNQVGSFAKPDSIFLSNGRLDIDETFTLKPTTNFEALKRLFDFQSIHGYRVTERVLVDEDLSKSKQTIVNLHVQTDKNQELTHPVYLPGYQCYEMLVGHHDTQTDIFCLGLILGSAVMGLDLYDPEDLNQFAVYRNQPAGLNARIHPTVCALVTEMTELDRAQRSNDLHEIVQRLKFYREYDPLREVDLSKLAALQVKKPTDRKGFILSKLKNRLFDTSRRNRLLYYKPNSRFVNLTVSSVPMVLHYQSINPQLLFTWNKEISGLIIKQNDISLNKYLRFEDHPYLNAQLKSIKLQSENDKKEYGFSQLKLVVAFLHWHNLKEYANERIQSPLLLLPVDIERKKSLKEERFSLKIIDNTATINPVLANYLKDLYGIILPESIDFDDTSMEQFFQLVESQINACKQGVKLNYIDQPRIRIVHNIARQTINNYRKKLKQKAVHAFHQVDYSYSEDNYKPLGLELFRQKIQPRQSALEFLLSDNAHPAPQHFNEPANPAVKSTFELTDGETNPYSWDFDVCNVVLGNFNYKKMSLVSDYNKVVESGIEHPVFNELFSNDPKLVDQSAIINDPAEWFHVIAADPTQAKSVLYSRSQKSYIIQGPPGTGKSQTITNLIADFLAKGKTVLFICEKRAALDVVYHRLQQNQLAELCCYIHDSQSDKKEFIKDLKLVYEDFLKNKMDLSTIELTRKMTLEKLLDGINTLNHYHQQQNTFYPEAGTSTRKLVESLIRLKPEVDPAHIPKPGEAPDYKYWIEYGQVIDQLSKALEESGAEPQLANHPFSNLSVSLIKSDNPFALMDSLVSHSYNAIQHLSEIISKNAIPPEHAATLEHIKNLVQDSVILETLAQTKNLQLVDPSNPEAQEFETAYSQYKQLQHSYNQALETNSKWINKFSKQEVQQAIEMALKHEKSFFSFFNGNWRRLKKQIKKAYDFTSHNIAPSFSTVLKQLQEEYAEAEKLQNAKGSLQGKYHIDNIESTYVGIEVLRRKQGDKEIDYLLNHAESNQLVIDLSKLNNSLQQLELQLKQCLFGFEGKGLAQLKDEISTISYNAESLKYLLPALRKFSELPLDVQKFIRKLPLTPVQAEAAMANKTLDILYKNNHSFSVTNHKKIHETVKEIEKPYKELLKLNSDYIRALRRQNFLKHYELSNTAASVLSTEQKQLKKSYLEGRRILEHEMGKTMRYKSIRELASNDSGKVLKDIKPVWLMSPLSVSDSLPLNTQFFDVVIYDEASQITLEEGIPALFRAPQTIIVGDDKQMPPSNFFNTKMEDPEDLETIENQSEEEILSIDADSLLVQGSRKLNNTMLRWHYRSRYETLISYSNHAFYEAGLLTIPDKTIHHHSKPLLEIQQPEDGLQTAGLLLKDSISFHYLPNSVYEARSNMSEARYIAHMIKKLLSEDVKESIGIVAFSQEQQGIIEEALDNLALTDSQFADALEKAFNRKEDGQFTGLFVKNLENVQGDERDIIILSICYGYDSNRKMIMNFGPINRKGGEKRLNVIFSRAKKHMAIVSSIRNTDITNDYNDGANYLKRFLQYAEMVSTGNMSIARTILDSLVKDDQKAQKTTNESSITSNQIKEALMARGYVVDEKVGQSSFKCSLGIKKKTDDIEYCLGILIDDEEHYKNDDLVEQYFQRPAILESFGWKVINVFAKDWLEDPRFVLETIERKLSREEKDEEKPGEAQPANGTAAQINAEPQSTQEQTSPGLMLSPEGDKFWQVEQDNQQIKIRFGRKGTLGQVIVRSYQNQEEATRMKEEFIAEQIKLGYK